MSNRPVPARRPVQPPPSRQWRWLVVGVVGVLVVIAAVVAVVVTRGGDEGPAVAQTHPVNIAGPPLPEHTDSAADPAVGLLAPTINGRAFDGASINVRSGTPTLLIFLAHWCPHCQAEVPVLAAWAAAGGVPDGVDVIGVATSTDRLRDNFPPSEWLEREAFPFPVIADSDTFAAARAYGLTSYPYFVAVDADGTVRARTSGELDPASLTALLTSMTTPSG